MKSRSLILPVVFAALVLGCSHEATAPKSANEAVLVLNANLNGTAVASVVVEVTGPGIPDTLVFNLTVANGQASGTLRVPAGSARVITVHAFDAQGIETHRGSTTIDVQPGTNNAVTVVLTSLVGSQPIVVTVGALIITVKPDSSSLNVGDTLRLHAVVTDSLGDTVNVPVSWASTNPGIVSVDTLGLASGKNAGSIRAVAVYGSAAGTALIVVPGPIWVQVPAITTNDLYAVWGSSSSDVWVVGVAGTVLHFDGNAWTALPPITTKALTAIWGSGPSDIWADAYTIGGGGGQLFHYNGAVWAADTTTIPPHDALGALWGSSATDVWTGGDAGYLLHYDGSHWSQVANSADEAVDGIWGSSGTDVWAVLDATGTAGPIIDYNGSAWSSATAPAVSRLWTIWGSGSSNVWAGGDAGALVHYDGSNWAAVASATTATIRGIWGSSSANVWTVGTGGTIVHYDGSSWKTWASPTGEDLFGAWGSSATNIWFVGAGGTILREHP